MDKMDKGERRSGIEVLYKFFLLYTPVIDIPCQTKTLVLPFISEWKDANSGQR